MIQKEKEPQGADGCLAVLEGWGTAGAVAVAKRGRPFATGVWKERYACLSNRLFVFGKVFFALSSLASLAELFIFSFLPFFPIPRPICYHL
jgi:hypothetical protein